MPKEWVRQRKNEHYYRKAKEEQYRSRATYKLMQVAEKYGFIRGNDVVVDLGAAPGGWLQIARKIVGDRGFVLGVDINEIEPLNEPNIYTIVGDITEPETTNRIKAILPTLADVVVSDISPRVSGIWELDHARQIELAECSLQIATAVLRKEGNFFVKVFQGDMSDDFIRKVKTFFHFVKVIKPKASRKESAEIYVLGMGFRSQR